MAGSIPGRVPVTPGRAYRNWLAPWSVLGRASFLRVNPSCMFAQLTSWENLLRAFRRASRGKRGRSSVAAFEHRLEENLVGLREALRVCRYRPGAYASFYIHEPKRRLISAAPFRDRVVHHALCQVIEPLFERSFIVDSFANRVGRGTHRALDRAQHDARRFPYVLQLDIRQFFPSIDHAILHTLLAVKITDARVLRLIDRVLESGVGVLAEEYRMVYFPGDDLFAANRPRGLPIGNLTSQFWGNVYLNPLDHFIKRELRCPGYVRYVDDALLFAEERGELWAWKQAIARRLEQLRLTLHAGAHPRPVPEGILFLGFVLYPAKRRLKRRKGIQFRRRLRDLTVAWEAGLVPTETVVASVRGWLNHARYAHTVGLAKVLLGSLPAEILQNIPVPWSVSEEDSGI